MGWGNVPDDWGCYYNKCGRCGSTYHASEGGCGCLDDHVECAHRSLNHYGEECYVHVDDAIEIDGRNYCESHAQCAFCGKQHGDVEWLKHVEGDLYCNECWIDEDDDES